jgi:hypothetical protein
MLYACATMLRNRSLFALRLIVTLSCSAAIPSLAVDARAQAQMSETEKKAAARSAYQEGVQLQDSGKYAEALARFEAAQKLFDAPTHVLHIAQCQAKTGRLVEASETYEALTRRTLAPDAPEAFRQAQEQARQELPELRPRIPTLRVIVRPDPAQSQMKDLRVTVNGTQMPAELVGIARPINPGTYRVTAEATGWTAQGPAQTSLGEREAKSVEITMVQGGGAAVAPVPPPYSGGQTPPPKEEPQKEKEEGSSSIGLLAGVRGGAFVPGGSIGKNATNGNDISMDKFATAGGGFGIDAYLRLVKLLLVGGTFEYASLGTPSQLEGVPSNMTVTATNTTTYFGASLGVVPNIDRVSFIGDAGLGRRQMSQTLESGNNKVDSSVSGLEFALGAGVSIPAGQYLRIVPKASLNLGSFTNACVNNTCADIQKTAGHTVFFVGVALYFTADLGKKGGSSGPAPSTSPPASTTTPTSAPLE